jgi:sporadic carbohydrate cluster 2OG-Fe(II) oxygenase
MGSLNSFLSKEDILLSEEYLKNGYVIRDSASYDSIQYLRDSIVNCITNILGCEKPENPDQFLNQIHEKVKPNELNNFRLSVIKGINDDPNFLFHYFQSAKPYLESLVGNELSMQLRVNLSIQMPNDESSLLPVHSDTWSGDSPYEVVVWIPLVDCFRTKAMYLLSPENSKKLVEVFSERAGKNSEELFQSISKEVRFLDMKYGQVMIFDQGFPHGNRLNEENETRWSMNCRFKSVFTPYGDKKIGEFFEPITIRAASRIGMNYKFPVVK